jgi:tripartite-type tricarboxylate transporter receptor subunit TctC
MQVWRRDFLRLAAGAAAIPINSRLSSAQSYPTRPVQIIVGFPAGSGPDIVARLAAQWLGERLGQQFVVDNRPGAGSNLGTEAAARATPDGYTMLFIAYAKANPGKINMASSGVGSASHVTGELFKMMANVDMIHVPYRSNYLPDLLSGQVQVTFAPTPSVIGYIKQGQLRALGVTSVGRQDLLPDVPAVAEFVPGYEAIGWYGFGVPAGTPSEIIHTLTKAINAIVAEPAAKEKLAGLGLDPMAMSTPEFDKFVREETQKWAQVIKYANITVN